MLLHRLNCEKRSYKSEETSCVSCGRRFPRGQFPAVHLAASRCGQAGKSPQTATQDAEVTDDQEEPTDDRDVPSREPPTDKEDTLSRKRREKSSGEEATASKRGRIEAAPPREGEPPLTRRRPPSGRPNAPHAAR